MAKVNKAERSFRVAFGREFRAMNAERREATIEALGLLHGWLAMAPVEQEKASAQAALDIEDAQFTDDESDRVGVIDLQICRNKPADDIPQGISSQG